MKKAIVAVFGLIVSASPALAHSLDGAWGLYAESCSRTAESEGVFTLDVAMGEIWYYESFCSFTQLTPVGDWDEVWRATLTCNGEGENWTTDTVFALFRGYDGEADRLAQVNILGGWASLSVRCGK